MKNDSNRQSMGKFINFLDRYDIINFSKNYRTIIFLSILLLLGMVLGTISISAVNMDFIYKVDFLFLNDFKELQVAIWKYLRPRFYHFLFFPCW